MTHGSLVRRAAAMIGSAEFFEPETRMVPFSFLPPCTKILSINRENEALPTLVIGRDFNVLKIPHAKQIARRVALAVSDFKRQASPQYTGNLVSQALDEAQTIGSAIEGKVRITPDFGA